MTATTAPSGPSRPTVALSCSPGGTAALRPLAGAVARRRDLRSVGRCPHPVALLASDPDALARGRRALGPDAPPTTAVAVDGHLVVTDADGREHRLVLPVAPVVATAALPPLAPHVRRRWRERLGLPADLVVDTAAVAAEDVPTALAVAAAAVVDARHLATALALGCPAVTDAGSAASVGATDGAEVVVGGRADAIALAADDARAARLSRRARALAVERLDPETTARRLLALWGLVDRTPADRVAGALAELGTAPGSPPCRRAADALSLFGPPPSGGR